MWPILVSFGPVKIYSFGLLFAIGLFLGLYWWWKMGRDEHWDEILLFDSFFLSLFVFVITGRLGYILFHSDKIDTLYRSLAFLSYPGFNTVIGVIGLVVFLILFARAHDWQVFKMLDSSVVAISMVSIWGAMGGLLNGNNPGRVASWGVMYPGMNTPVIPVDAVMILWSIVTFVVVSRVRKDFRFYSWYKGEASTAQDGLAALMWVGLYGGYFAISAWLVDGMMMAKVVPVTFVIGLAMIMGSIFAIYKRVGRRDDSLWGKLLSIIRRK